MKHLCVLFFVIFSSIQLYAQNDNQAIKSKEYKVVSPTANENARRAYNNGTQCLENNDLDNAEILLKQAIELDPNYADAYDHLGILYRLKSQFSDAEKVYLKSIDLRSDNLVAYNNLALIYKLQRRYQDDYNTYIKMIAIDPTDPEGYFGSGVLLLESKHYKESKEIMAIAINIYSEQNSDFLQDAIYYQCYNLYNLNQYVELKAIINNALSYFPNDSGLIEMNKKINTSTTSSGQS